MQAEFFRDFSLGSLKGRFQIFPSATRNDIVAIFFPYPIDEKDGLDFWIVNDDTCSHAALLDFSTILADLSSLVKKLCFFHLFCYNRLSILN